MRLTGATIAAFVAIPALYAGSSEATAGPQCSGQLTLINGTPYAWKIDDIHSYQMGWDWPEYIKAHSSYEMCYKFKKNDDDAGEVTYRIMAAPSPMSFEIQAQKIKGPERTFHVQYREDLASLNNARDSRIELNHVRHGGFIFVLAGDGTGDSGFDVSSNPPVAWMQETFDTIGELSLRDVVMPASHDSGMSKLTRGYGGVEHNTLTQSASIYDQLRFGIRFFDIRPVHRRGTFWTGHLAEFSGTMTGGLGVSLEEVVNDINRFNKEFPGELIILDITHIYARRKGWGWGALDDEEWQLLYEQFSNIEDLFSGALQEDASAALVSDYISRGGASSVIIRLPHYANLPIEGRSVDAIKVTLSDLILRADTMDLGPCVNTVCVDGWDVMHNEKKGECGCQMISGYNPSSPAMVQHDVAADYGTESRDYTQTTTSAETDALNRAFDAALITKSAIQVRPVSRAGAFIYEGRMPHVGSYSASNDMYDMAQDQIRKLHENRYIPNKNDLLRSTWTLTQSWNQISNPGVQKDSIECMAEKAHELLFPRLWPELSKRTYPNLIEVDYVRNSQFTALAMAINRHFANPFDGAIRVRRDIEARDVAFVDDLLDEEIDGTVVKAPGSGDGFFWDMENTKNYWAWKWCRARKNREDCMDEKKEYVYHRRILEATRLNVDMEKSDKDWKKWVAKANAAKEAGQRNLEAQRRRFREYADEVRRKENAARRKQEEAEKKERQKEEAKRREEEEKQHKKEEAERQKNRG